MEIKYALTELDDVALVFERLLGDHRIFSFHGNLGAGKTTLINAICKRLEVEDNVSSPTFSIINQYFSPKVGKVYHMDLYRLGSVSEAIDAGVEDAVLSGDICFVEWSENAPSLFEDALHCSIEVAAGNLRILKIKL